MELIPIDHGLCLPESLEDPYFEWIHWPQASISFSDGELEYIANLDPIKDFDMLHMELPMIREACLWVLILRTIFLKEAASFGIFLAEIEEMMSREFTGREEEPSELEFVCIEARRLVAEREMLLPPKYEPVGDKDEFQFVIDCGEAEPTMIPRTPPPYNSNPFSKLESLDEEEDSNNEENTTNTANFFNRAIPKLSMSLKGVSLTEKIPHAKGGNTAMGKSNNSSGGNQSGNGRSANEQLPVSVSFMKLADMSEDEWVFFLNEFQELLNNTFRARTCGAMGPKQRQKLGTSY